MFHYNLRIPDFLRLYCIIYCISFYLFSTYWICFMPMFLSVDLQHLNIIIYPHIFEINFKWPLYKVAYHFNGGSSAFQPYCDRQIKHNVNTVWQKITSIDVKISVELTYGLTI